MSTLEQKLGRPASEKEMAADMNISVEEYRQQLECIECGRLEALVEEPVQSSGNEPEKCEISKQLGCAIQRLPPNERQLLGFFYQQELNQCEIALVFGVTEARICQIHKQALLRLKSILLQDSTTGMDAFLC